MLSLCAAALAVPSTQEVATLDHVIALKQSRPDVGFEDSATPQITVHGDPIFRFGKNHNATRLWLPTGVLKTLLTWEATGGKTLSLVGKTFHPRHNNTHGVKKTDEWFQQLLITVSDPGRGEGEVRVLDVSASQEDLGTMEIALDDKLMTPVPGKDTYTSQEHHKVAFTTSKHRKTGADQLHVQAGGLALSIYISKAAKFTSEKDQIKFSHLNMKFDGGLPKHCAGVFAELAGIQPISPKTEKLLQRPKKQHTWQDDDIA